MTDAPRPQAVSPDKPERLVVVLGPTGSGKSELALTLAARRGEVVNFDSVQVYRDFNVGSAKVPYHERRGIPHHLIDFAGPDVAVTAGSFAREATRIIEAISLRRALPVLVGGTGFYLRALLDGLSPAPERDSSMRDRLQGVASRRPLALHRFLRRFDPAAAWRIHQNDQQKLIRAVEMTLAAGKPASATQALPRQALTGYDVLKIGLQPERGQLYERLNRRTVLMFEQGLLEETAALLEAGVPRDAKPMQSLGYKQAVAVLSGECSLPQAIGECQVKTRQYAKRQVTWFRRETGVHWIAGFGSERRVQADALAVLEQWTRNNEESASA